MLQAGTARDMTGNSICLRHLRGWVALHCEVHLRHSCVPSYTWWILKIGFYCGGSQKVICLLSQSASLHKNMLHGMSSCPPVFVCPHAACASIFTPRHMQTEYANFDFHTGYANWTPITKSRVLLIVELEAVVLLSFCSRSVTSEPLNWRKDIFWSHEMSLFEPKSTYSCTLWPRNWKNKIKKIRLWVLATRCCVRE